MIVADTNLVVALCLPSPFTPVARELWQRVSVWHAPMLWKSEFRSVLVGYCRRQQINEEESQGALARSTEAIPSSRTHLPDDERVVRLALESRMHTL